MKGEQVCAFRVNMINSDVIKQLKQLEEDKYIEMINVGNYEDVNEDKVYVIYYKGELYTGLPGNKCKTAYLKESYAKAIITYDSKYRAERDYNGNWYDLSKSEKQKYIDAARKDFEIKEFTEKCKLR